ncbi:MAG: tetratricopeptide repeat protein, partial [Gemmatimonadaceae bacterium]|nr:tetratricopeptide repeat protein [Gemmatimonadaceae bacterium]
GTKSVTATLPAALLVVLWWRHGRLAYRHDVRPLLPWFIVAIASGALTAWFEHRLIGANGAEFALSWVQRVLLSGRVIVHYASTLFWPTTLIFTYPRWEIIPSWTALLYPVGVALTLIVGWLLRARSRAPLAVLLLFCGTLTPVLGFVNVYPFRYAWVADHFQYLANIAPMVGLAAAVWTLPQRWARTAAVAAVALLAGMSWRQSGEYRDPITLYRATLARNDASWMAHHNLARLLANRPEARAEAIAHYQRATALKPDHARAYYGVGVLLQRDGRTAEAITALERARTLEPRNAQLVANASFLLGELYESRGDARTAAIAAYALADSLKPGVPQTQQALARARRAP